MGVVWWATHKLTFDCTLLDEDQDAGVGLLQESGLDPSALADTSEAATDSTARSNDDPEAMDTSLLPHRPWWKLWELDAGEARRPHAPGVWLIYFTIASLPLFGLGQWLVPAVEEDRRAWLFLYFLAYIASGMGLLLATSFLNLRRYLRRRKLKMPAAMTATWLSTGAILIVGLTVLAAAVAAARLGLEPPARFRRRIKRPPRLEAMRFSRTAASRARGPRAKDRPHRRDRTHRPPRARRRGRGRPTIPTPRSRPPARDVRGARKDRGDPRRRRRRASRLDRNPVSRARKGLPRISPGDAGKKQDGRAKDKADVGKMTAAAPTRTTKMLLSKTTRSPHKRIRVRATVRVRRSNFRRCRSQFRPGCGR